LIAPMEPAIAAGRWTAISNAHKLCRAIEVCKFDAARSFPGRRRTIHAGGVSARMRKPSRRTRNMSVIDKANLIEKSRETVEQIMARRGAAKTYEEKAQYASDIVDMHLHEENPERIDECIKLYTADAVWETPARNVTYKGRENIKKMYLRIFNSVENIAFHPIERFSTPDRVFDDMLVTFRLIGDGFENCPVPIGTKVKMRLLHNFHIRNGMIAKEIGYEIWGRDD
jgi:SnoaL-like domain